ncbi:histone deacetylase family protein [Aliikangiella sp. G2MR2-5]|uniref:histone deacetylase family protein n=1 Tax=Aliikangiella sp. G2MR2-5 TaxID=2788943 RepID=UPI0018AA024A|nr:histone deacetylase family protein [Aliikangiella sp. G2MR2-5]
MPVCIISHPDCNKHVMGEFHPECPARLGAISDQLIASGLDYVLRQFDATPIEKSLLSLAHEQSYIDFVFDNAPDDGCFALDPDTSMNPYSLAAALLSAGAGIMAVDKVMEGDFGAAFCATRPPGHHAERNKAMGFCIFNNIAIAALYAKQKYQLDRVAILDFDVHHGNGTEEIMRDKEGVLFCSTFQHPFYPFSGTGNHPTHIVNTPLPANAGSTEFRNAVTENWLPALKEYKPQLILISAGFDAHAEDDMSQVRLYEHDYRWVTDQIKLAADKYCSGKMVSMLEGGYALGALGRSVVAHIKGLIGD